MSTNNKNEWSCFFQEIKDNVRNHAGYFSWEKNRAIQEVGVVQAFTESLENKGMILFRDCKSRKDDPPDCEARNDAGEPIGIEVTELVDGNSIAKAREDKCVPWEPWSIGRLEQTISERLSKKDNPVKVKGGPYKEYILIIYCDEPAILDYTLIEHIKNNYYKSTSLITRAFFLMSYCPREKCCPYVELKLKNA